jgi:uncharacterized membrane protein YhdT
MAGPKSGLSYKARRRWSLIILVIGLPAYIVVAVTILNHLGSLPKWLELPVYVIVGLAWVVPLRFVFRGIGQPDPDAPPRDDA